MTEKIIKIDELFPDGKTVSALKITEYLNWAAHPEEYSQVLAMPPIQRGFVWKPKQIQDLWDSLLRGMPIGSVLLKTTGTDELSAGLSAVDRKVEKSNKSGFQLMDGQQRTLAMLLGFPSDIKVQHKLWIDFSEPGKGGSQFQFRVSTEAQPFGFSTDGARLSLDDRRKARNSWDREDEDRKKKSNQEIFNDEATRPWKASANKQDYLFEVKVVWKWLKDIEISDWVEKIENTVKKNDFEENILNQRIESFGKALKALENQWLALIKIPEPEVNNQDLIEDPSHDYLTMLFDRISSGGTRLSPDDLLFSMIKHTWPDAHNIVYNLHEKVGALMKPTDFVMTAFRLAALQSNEIKGDPELNAKTFHKHLFDLLGSENDDSKILRKMIKEDGPLVKAFEQLIELIKYKGDDGDSGIPSTMLPYMNVSMLQVILYWLIRQENTIDLYESRNEILRFVLFWFVCNKDAKSSYEASKAAIKITTNSTGTFPGELIYQALTTKDDYGWSLPSLIMPPKASFDGDEFRKQNEREEKFFGKENSLLYGNFTARRTLLLWFQRKWIEQKFHPQGNFKFLAGQDEDNVPYDLDHLVPQSNWSSLRGVYVDEIKNEKNRSVFAGDIYHRRALGNSIGNYRVMDSSENRSRGDMPLAGSDMHPQEKGFLEHHDQWSNYAFNPDDVELKKWEIASPKEKYYIWNDERLLAFQYAIESRVLHLYNRFYDELGFSAWLKADTKQ